MTLSFSFGCRSCMATKLRFFEAELHVAALIGCNVIDGDGVFADIIFELSSLVITIELLADVCLFVKSVKLLSESLTVDVRFLIHDSLKNGGNEFMTPINSLKFSLLFKNSECF